jgi:tetrapyrrole methylase family protein/MazG family protein
MKINEEQPLYKLKEIAKILRSENGCAWDKEQTSQTLKPYLIEETYELYDAIEQNNAAATLEELGDVLYRVYAHA